MTEKREVGAKGKGLAASRLQNPSDSRQSESSPSGPGKGQDLVHDTDLLRPLFRSRSTVANLAADTAVVWKTAIGAVVAWEVARLTGSTHPYLAPLTVILCLQATIGQSIRFAWQRSVGTVVGVLIIGLIARDLPMTAWMLGVVLLVSTGVMKAIGLNDKVIHQIALSVLFVWYFEQHSPGYGWDRAKDTVIGAVTAIVFMIVIAPPNQTEQAANSMMQFVDEMARAVGAAGTWMKRGYLPTGAWNAEAELQIVRSELHRTMGQMSKAAENTRFNLYVNKKRHQAVQAEFDVLREAYVHFSELTHTLVEWTKSGKITREEAIEWGESLERLSTWMREVKVRLMAQTTASGELAVPVFPQAERGAWAVAGLSDSPYPVLAYHEVGRMIRALNTGLKATTPSADGPWVNGL